MTAIFDQYQSREEFSKVRQSFLQSLRQDSQMVDGLHNFEEVEECLRDLSILRHPERRSPEQLGSASTGAIREEDLNFLSKRYKQYFKALKHFGLEILYVFPSVGTLNISVLWGSMLQIIRQRGIILYDSQPDFEFRFDIRNVLLDGMLSFLDSIPPLDKFPVAFRKEQIFRDILALYYQDWLGLHLLVLNKLTSSEPIYSEISRENFLGSLESIKASVKVHNTTINAALEEFEIRSRGWGPPFHLSASNPRIREGLINRYAEEHLATEEDPILGRTASNASGHLSSSHDASLWKSALSKDTTVTATLATLFFVMLSFVPGYVAWQKSSRQRGQSTDSDFWFLIQSSMIQIIGVFTILLSMMLHKTELLQHNIIPWLLLVISILCSVVSIPLYLIATAEWSTTVSSIGSVAQTFVTLQALLVKERRKKEFKEQ